MELKLNAEKITWPESHYLFLEKRGPFVETAPKCWEEFRALINPLKSQLKMKSFASLYKIQPEMIYRAGMMLLEKPALEIPGLRYEKFKGGPYLLSHFMGNYGEIPEACGRVFDDLHQKRVEMADYWGIENYLTDPEQTAADKNIVQILIPIQENPEASL